MRNRIFAVSEYFPWKYLLVTNGKRITSSWRNPAHTTSIKWPKWWDKLKSCCHVTGCKRKTCPFSDSPAKASSEPIMRKRQTKPNWGTFYKMNSLYSSEMPRSWGPKEGWARLFHTEGHWWDMKTKHSTWFSTGSFCYKEHSRDCPNVGWGSDGNNVPC